MFLRLETSLLCPVAKSAGVPKRMISMSLTEFVKNPKNEPVLNYAPGSSERVAVDAAIDRLKNSVTEIPIVIGDKEIKAGVKRQVRMPSNHTHVLANYFHADSTTIKDAIENCLAARKSWEAKSLQHRADIFFKAGDLVANKYRADLNAATMLGQAKTYVQAEIDSACELADFFRFNAYFALHSAQAYQPISEQGVKNEFEFRGLDGFVAAISPFNFTAIGGNLCGAPALMGNVVAWKPSDTSVLANWLTYRVLREAGLPPGVINFLPSDGPVFGNAAFSHAHLAAVNFTGSVATFRHIWRQVASNLDHFETFPRLIGECGGKNFHFVHTSADIDTVAPCSIRAAFEYQGQKCSALSRMYVPKSRWPEIRDKMVKITKEIVMGQPDDKNCFLSAVIDKTAFDRVSSFIEHAKNSKNGSLKIVTGGKCDGSKGYFIEPTIVECQNTKEDIFCEEIFGPVLAVYPYDDADCISVLNSVKSHTKYALTGAVFAHDQKFLQLAKQVLRDSCGNFYINDKCTGSVVGQQPFGGAGLSGTNDKAGGPHYILRWVSPLTTKTTSVKLPHWRYPSMD